MGRREVEENSLMKIMVPVVAHPSLTSRQAWGKCRGQRVRLDRLEYLFKFQDFIVNFCALRTPYLV